MEVTKTARTATATTQATAKPKQNMTMKREEKKKKEGRTKKATVAKTTHPNQTAETAIRLRTHRPVVTKSPKRPHATTASRGLTAIVLSTTSSPVRYLGRFPAIFASIIRDFGPASRWS